VSNYEKDRDAAAKQLCMDWPYELYHHHDLEAFFEHGADWARARDKAEIEEWKLKYINALEKIEEKFK